MKNLELIFSNNKHKSGVPYIQNKYLKLNMKADVVNGDFIYGFVGKINEITDKYGKNSLLSIVINLGETKFADKLTYIIFECLMYYLVSEYKYNIKLNMTPKFNITTEGIAKSPLIELNGNKDSKVRFKKRFDFDSEPNHYRRVLGIDNKGTLDDLNSILKNYEIDDDNREEICLTFSEIIGNATEHGESDCLIDIDITNDYGKKEQGKRVDGIYYGINIVVINISNLLLGTKMKEKILNSELKTPRYLEVKNAYNNHSKFFSDSYEEEDFFNIVAFQDKITSRIPDEKTGGRGLTQLIDALEEDSDANNCYVLSGNKVLWFREGYLKYNEDRWIGFNKNNDFINEGPDKENISRCKLMFPGTAYNLQFVMRKKEK